MKGILFVDDDRDALDSLRARLHSHRSEWRMNFLSSASAAVTEMARTPYDVLVTDLRMMPMSGAELLDVARRRWPELVRIVLSADSREAQNLRLVSIAHRFLAKPCDISELEGAIARCFALKTLLQRPALHATVGRVSHLPVAPRIFSRLQAALASAEVTATTVSAIVQEDPVIAGRVLQVVNSAFFRLARKITRIEGAVNYLGFAAIRNLVLSAEVFAQWPTPLPGARLLPEELQAHSRQVTLAVKALTAGSPLRDDAMLAALMQDIGYWVLLQEFPTELNLAFAMSEREKLSLMEAEERAVGCSHAEIGAYLLGLWDLPFPVIEAVAFHHGPLSQSPSSFDIVTALALANALVCEEQPASPLARHAMAKRLDADTLNALGAPFDWTEARRRVAHALAEDRAA